MEDMVVAWPFVIPMVFIVFAFVFIIVKTLANARVRELEIRERIAMIERGLVPAPETDPRGFERAMRGLDRSTMGDWRDARRGGARHRRAGVTLMGVGFGLMVLIAFAGGDVGNAIGVGGFLVVIGIAFFINSLIDSSESAPPTPAEPPRRD